MSGIKVGYARVSTNEQSTDLQLEQLKAIGCTKVFSESGSGKSVEAREELKRCIEFLREGDTLYVTKVDRVARNTIDALTIADQLKAKGVGIVFLDLGDVDINSDVGRVIYTTISAFAEMERKRILLRCNEGRAKAKAEGKHLGRKRNEKNYQAVRELLDAGTPKTQIAKRLGISRQNVYEIIKAFEADTKAT